MSSIFPEYVTPDYIINLSKTDMRDACIMCACLTDAYLVDLGNREDAPTKIRERTGLERARRAEERSTSV